MKAKDNFSQELNSIDDLYTLLDSLNVHTIATIRVEYKRVTKSSPLLGKGDGDTKDTQSGEYIISVIERYDEDFYYATIANISTLRKQKEDELEELIRIEDNCKRELEAIKKSK